MTEDVLIPGSDEDFTVACGENLESTIQRLRNTVDKKESTIQQVRAELDLKNVQLRRLEKLNGKLTKQLEEERNHYHLDKQQLCAEIIENKRALAQIRSQSSEHQPKSLVYNRLLGEVAALKAENEKLREIVLRCDKKNHEICVKYLRMQRCKDLTWSKLQEVDHEFVLSLKNLIDKFNNLREEYNLIFGDRYLPLGKDEKKFAEITKKSCDLLYENSCLQLELQCLKRDLHCGIYNRKESRRSYGSTSKEAHVKESGFRTRSWSSSDLKSSSSSDFTSLSGKNQQVS